MISGLTDDFTCKKIEEFLYNNYSGEGHIVELGTFLGKVTQSLSRSVELKNIDKKIYTYDYFTWNFNHQKKFPDENLNIGDCFLEKAKKNVNSNSVIFNKTLIENINYYHGPIEIIVLDAPKNFHEIYFVIKYLSKFFIKKKTKIIFLDYFISIKYDSQIFLKILEEKNKIFYFQNSLLICEIYQKPNLVNVKNDLNKIYKLFSLKENIKKFWIDIINLFPNEKKKILSLLPALHMWDNKFYFSSMYYVIFEDCYVEKKYLLIPYMIKRYPILSILFLYKFLIGKWY